MKFGVTIPNNWGIEDPQQVFAMGTLAEELGYDSLWVMDHLRPLKPAVQAINAQFDVILSAMPGIAAKAAIVAERRPS